MCGGSAQTTQQVQIPPEVMQNYRAVNARATEVAATPFQQYSTDPNAFVAPINQTQQSGINAISAAGGVAQPYFQGATQQLMGGQAAATPYYGEATQQLLGGLNAGVTGTQAAYQPMQQGAQAAQDLQGGALAQYQGALQSAQPYNQAADQYAQAGLSAATPYYGQAAQNVTGAQDVGGALGGAALNSLQQAGQAAQPLQSNAAENINSAASAAQPYNQAATAGIMGGLAGSQPFNAAAARGINQAQAGAQPYQGMATGLAAAGTQAVNAGPLGGDQINQYMSPYLNSVVGSTMANLRQQQDQEQSSLLGNQVSQGAFGGDRGRIAQANLARQQDLATGQTVSGLMNQGYGQALGAAQQQQQLGLGAAQANRAALQQGANQMLGIGQQGYSQGMGAAQAQQGLGQQIYGQGLGAGQAMAGIGQQQYGQQLGTGQAQAALGSQLFGQGAQTAQQQAALGQQQYSQGMGAASAQQGLGQGLYGMGTGMGGFMQGLGQQNYAQQSGTGQNLAQLGQQQFGQGAAQTAQQAALAQQQYGMGAGAAGTMAGLGQGLYGMGAGTSQALAGMGTQAQQNALAAGQAQLGAGTVAQQTQQAGQTALYNQFLQQQGFPYQQAQFLANIAMGTGALSGSTTQTTQPMPFFSDERLKEAVEPIGKTFDGQKIVKFRYKNEPGTRIGLIAQDVEKHHPDAVGLAGGYKTVDYDAATKDAASKGHYARGGLAPESEGGAVLPFPMRRGFAEGGNPAQLIGNDEMAAILQAQFGMYGNQGIPGLGGSPGAPGFVPAGTLPVGNLTVAGDAPKLPESQLKGMLEASGGLGEAYKSGKAGVKEIKSWFKKDEPAAESETTKDSKSPDKNNNDPISLYRGGLVGHYASGGASSGPYGIPLSHSDTPDLMVAGDPPPVPKSGFTEMMDDAASIADLASSMSPSSKKKAAGGKAEKDIGSGTPYDAGSNPYMPDSAESIDKKELAKPGAAPDAPESGFSQGLHFAKDVGSIAALAALMNRGGRIGKDGGGPLDEDSSANLPHIPLYNSEIPENQRNPAGYRSLGEQLYGVSTAPNPNISDNQRRQYREAGNKFLGMAQTDTAKDAEMPMLDQFANFYHHLKTTSPVAYFMSPNESEANRKVISQYDTDAAAHRAAVYAATGLSPSGTNPPVAPGLQPSASTAPLKAYRMGSDPAAEAKLAGRTTPANPVTPRPNVARPAAPGIAPPLPAPINVSALPPIRSEETGAGMAPGLGGSNAISSAQAPVDTHAAEGALLARTGLGAPNIRQDLAQPQAPQPPTPPKPGFLERAGNTLAPKGGYLDRLASGDEDAVIPFLQGIGAMASSSNRYGLGALAEGIGAGAGALQSTQMNRARISEARAVAGKAMQGIGFATIGGRDWAIMPDGSRMLVGEYLALPANKRPTLAGSAELPNIISGHPEWGQSSMPGQSATPDQSNTMATKSLENMPMPHGEVPKFVGGIGRAQADRDFAALMPLSDDQRAPQMEISKAVEANTIQDATSAYNQGGTLNQLTEALLKLPANEALSGGPLFDFKAGLLNKANDVIKTVASTLHMDPTQYLVTTPEQNDALGWKAASDKLTGFLRIATTKGANQNSLGALDEVASMVPNSSLTKDQAAKILAGQYIDKQRALDRFNYLNEYKSDVAEAHPGMSNMYLAQNADAAFRKEHPDQEYGKAKENIIQMLNTTMNDGNSLFYWVYSGKTKPETIDKLFKFPGFSRYVTNQ